MRRVCSDNRHLVDRHTQRLGVRQLSCVFEPNLNDGSEPVALGVDDENDENEHDEAKLRQSNACEHQHLLWTVAP
jgi:hypothetical protein